MKKTLLFASLFFGLGAFAQDCSNLFISEYVEGWSNNKALEIYNPTDAAIDLSAYFVARYGNGSTSADASNSVQLSGMIPARGVFVAVLEKLDPNGTGNEAPIWDSLQARADGYFSPDYNTSNAFYWNGDDAVVLAKGVISDVANAQVMDIFGKIGEDPGSAWTSEAPHNGPGAEVTKDHSMIRKSTVLKGEINPVISVFNPLAQYDSIPAVYVDNGTTYGNWSTLGSHDCACNTLGLKKENAAVLSVSPNPTSGMVNIKGTQNITTVSIYNSLGQQTKTIQNTANSVMMVDVSDKKGVYFIRMMDKDGNSTTQRVIVK